MKKIVLCACGIIIAGGFMFLGLPGQPGGSAYSGSETFPGNAVPAIDNAAEDADLTSSEAAEAIQPDTTMADGMTIRD